MFRINAVFLLLVVFTFGVWGCSRTNAPVASAEKALALEARNQQLEDDLRAVTQIREQLRGKLLVLETAQSRMTGEIDGLRSAVTARDVALKTRTDERDRLRGKVDDVHAKLKDILSATETTRAEWTREVEVASTKPTEVTR